MAGNDSSSIMGTMEVMGQLPVWTGGGVLPEVGSLSWPGFPVRSHRKAFICRM
jgi:hypothetical protein